LLATILFPFKKITNSYRWVSKKANANIYNELSVDFNNFYQILLLKNVVYRLFEEVGEVSDDPSDSCDSELDAILYSASSQAPKSMSLHRWEQKGKNFASSDCSLIDTSTVL
jgi:hypothetical protein